MKKPPELSLLKGSEIVVHTPGDPSGEIHEFLIHSEDTLPKEGEPWLLSQGHYWHLDLTYYNRTVGEYQTLHVRMKRRPDESPSDFGARCRRAAAIRQWLRGMSYVGYVSGQDPAPQIEDMGSGLLRCKIQYVGAPTPLSFDSLAFSFWICAHQEYVEDQDRLKLYPQLQLQVMRELTHEGESVVCSMCEAMYLWVPRSTQTDALYVQTSGDGGQVRRAKVASMYDLNDVRQVLDHKVPDHVNDRVRVKLGDSAKVILRMLRAHPSMDDAFTNCTLVYILKQLTDTSERATVPWTRSEGIALAHQYLSLAMSDLSADIATAAAADNCDPATYTAMQDYIHNLDKLRYLHDTDVSVRGNRIDTLIQTWLDFQWTFHGPDTYSRNVKPSAPLDKPVYMWAPDGVSAERAPKFSSGDAVPGYGRRRAAVLRRLFGKK